MRILIVNDHHLPTPYFASLVGVQAAIFHIRLSEQTFISIFKELEKYEDCQGCTYAFPKSSVLRTQVRRHVYFHYHMRASFAWLF